MKSSRIDTRRRRSRPVVRQAAGSLLRPELFFPELDAASREDLFAKLAGALADLGVAQHREALCDALLERERLGTTALGRGIAVPHARSMIVGQTAVAFARTRHGIDFGAADGVAVRLVFLIVAPYGAAGAAYLPVVAAIARAVQDDARRTRLLELESFDELNRLLKPTAMAQEALTT
jgi:PTS system nitrogen regulatory IIA component